MVTSRRPDTRDPDQAAFCSRNALLRDSALFTHAGWPGDGLAAAHRAPDPGRDPGQLRAVAQHLNKAGGGTADRARRPTLPHHLS